MLHPLTLHQILKTVCALALAALGLTACAAGGPLAIGPSTDQVGDGPGFGRNTLGEVVFADDGEPLRFYRWPPTDRPAAEASMVIVAAHGYGDHATSTFAEAAEEWAASGAAVYAYDHRGFGKNRSRGAWPGPEALVRDVASVAQSVKTLHPEAPLVLIGHSMGGGISVTAVGEGLAPEVDALVLLAPAVWGGPYLPTRLRLATWLAAALFPDKRLTGSGMVQVQPSDSVALMRRLAADPFFLKSPSPREYMGLTRLMDRAIEAAKTVPVPVLMVWGKRDQIIPGRAIKGTFATMPEPKTYLEYPDGWHMLLRDNQGAVVRRDVLDWARKTVGVSDSPKP